MVGVRGLYLAFLGLLYLERLAELFVSRRNARIALARGGIEIGLQHYAVMVAVHAVFPLACGAEAIGLHRGFPGAIGVAALGLALAAQALRWWAVVTLGWRWNTRVIAVPGLAPVTTGPYRFLRHPNYLAVLVEAAAVPLIAGAWLSAVVFLAANAALLAIRIPLEERALGPSYAAAFAGHRRFVPGAPHA
ncbi:MAG: isoprenylcysteine carboxyl methyltransferase family protein [Thermoanaerobaculales bacterium]